ncbi:MAG: alpha/beta hydrolase [Bacteroidota bacterium]
MSHTPPIFIKHGKNSSALFTLNNPTTLVIFVHGFNGSATATWDDFPRLIRTTNDFAHADVIFYGYESLKGQANNNAIKFYSLLKAACENNPNKLGFERKEIGDDHSYKKILIIAHSLGAVIVRRALLNAKSENKIWLDKCKMILFAPAHRGARIPDLILESLPKIVRVLAGLGMIAIPIINDLRPNSQTILNLIADSEKLLEKNEGDFTIASHVIWANNEKVVHNQRFCVDPVATLIDNKSHVAVCKPNQKKYADPYSIVLKAL